MLVKTALVAVVVYCNTLLLHNCYLSQHDRTFTSTTRHYIHSTALFPGQVSTRKVNHSEFWWEQMMRWQ